MPERGNKIIPAIVLTSHTVGHGIIRALGLMGVPIIVFYYEKKDMGYVSKYVEEKIYTPHPEKSEKKFIDILIEYAESFGRGLLLPADDATLYVVSKNKYLLERYYIVACTDWEITEKYVNKKHTYAIAEEIGVPAPRTIIPKSFEDIETYSKNIQYPCLVKPFYSHRYFEIYRKKMVRVENFDQMFFAYQEATDAGIEVMLQEYIPGDDTKGVNYNSYFWNGKPLVEFTAEKVRLSPPGFGVPRVVISKHIPEIIEPGRNILQAMEYYGYSCTEFKQDPRDGIYKLMEVNGRHNRSGLLSVRCGINFPWIEYNHLVQGKLPSPCGYQNGIYWIDELRDIIHSAKYFKKERYTMNQYIRPYLRPHIFALFDWKDLKPFIKRCSDLVKMGIQGIFSLCKINFIKTNNKLRKILQGNLKKKIPPSPKIWIDLDNSPHVVFFRPIIEEFRKRGCQVVLTTRDCFQVCGLADRFNMPYKRIGRHYGKNKLIKVTGLFIRSIKLIPFVLKEKPTIALSHGSRAQVLAANILSIPSIVILDYEFSKGMGFIHSTWLIVPQLISKIKANHNNYHVLEYPGIKEDVYVPDFKPDPIIKEELEINDKDLVVTVRPPATEAHYHSRKSEELFEAVIDFLGGTPNLRMVLLPRNEKQEALVRKTWPRRCNNGKIIIPDRVVDGLNLIWHSDLVISGGGTMNREAAALGVPVYSIFRGKIGAVDQYLANSGRLVLLKSVKDVYTKINLNKCCRPRKIVHNSRVALHRIVDNIVGIIER